MLGVRSGFTTLVKANAPDIISTHCAPHREALAAKTLPPFLKEVLDVTVRCVNFIRAKSLNHRLFKLMAEELGAEYSIMLLHAGNRWLSREGAYELRMEIKTFLRENEHNKCNERRLSDWFEDPQFISGLDYLADVFGVLNVLNKSMQGWGVTVFEAREKVESFQSKLVPWKKRVEMASGKFRQSR